MVEWWNDGMMEWWNDGMVEWWSNGVLGCWFCLGIEVLNLKFIWKLGFVFWNFRN